MMKAAETSRRNSSKSQANRLNLLMFLTGACIGCMVVRLGGIGGELFPEPLQFGFADVCLAGFHRFPGVLLANVKFLLLLYLLAFMRCGAMLVPPVFAAEGLLLGCTVAAVTGAMGYLGTALLSILLAFRLVLVLPYGFLLGAWSVEHSLSYVNPPVSDHRTRASVLLVTLLVLLMASLLECTAAQWLGGVYFLRFGV